MDQRYRHWRGKAQKLLRVFLFAKGGNIAMMFGLSLIPLSLAAGAGLDLARAVMVRSSMADALDAAALAIGATPNISQSAAQSLAQQYFSANYHQSNTDYGTPAVPTVSIVGQSVHLSVTDSMPTTLLSAAHIDTVPITVSSTVVWGQSKLWVSLVLDNTGSMDEGDSGGTKMNALKAASHSLLTMLQSASTQAGDVQVAIVPFAKDVNVGTAKASANWIDWTDWQAEPPSGAPDFSLGPGSSCPWSTRNNGYQCVTAPDGSSTTNSIPSNGSYKGYFCPSVDNGSQNGGRTGHYYNGCYNSVAATQTTSTVIDSGKNATCGRTSNCSCSGKNKNMVCTQTINTSGFNHTWVVSSHSAWNGCIMDRTQNYDTTNTAPTSTATDFPAENSDYCPPAKVTPLGYSWTSLSSEVDSMASNGNTNQTVGLDHGMMTLANSTPYSAPPLPANTSQYIILLSDGANTQNRWSTSQSSIDARMAIACTSAKAAGITIYTIFLDIGGTSGNSTVLQNCASSSSKYYDLTSTGSVGTTFNLIAQQITNLRVSQ